MITRLLVAIVCLVSSLCGQGDFEGRVQPLLKRYCLGCHSTKAHVGDLDLERFATRELVLKQAKVWQRVMEQVSLGEMPPKEMPQPSVAERALVVGWIGGALKEAGLARAGDPGPVVLRRLNNAEYTNTIRDLTGVQGLNPTQEFPADGAAGEGFTNTGNALTMSPALVTKYLDAAKGIAAHAVLLPAGMRFSSSVSRSDWTHESLAAIRALYDRYTEVGGVDTVTQQGIALDKNRGGTLPLKKYLSATLEVRNGRSVAAVARGRGLSAKYLGTLMEVLRGKSVSPILDPIRGRWRVATEGQLDSLVRDLGVWQETLFKFNSVGHIGKLDGPKSWMEAVTPIMAEQEFRLPLGGVDAVDEVKLYLAASDAGDGNVADAVVWREPKLKIPGRPAILLRDVRKLVSGLSLQRDRVIAGTAAALNAATGGEGNETDSLARKAWFEYLGLSGARNQDLELLSNKIEKHGNYSFIQGWGGGKQPSVLANASQEMVRIPGTMRGRAVAVLPTTTQYGAIGWLSPITGAVRIETTITPAHAECGNGVTWSLELRRGRTRQRLAEGVTRGAKAVEVGPIEKVAVRRGDLVSVLIGPKDGNASCDLMDVDWRLTDGITEWSLRNDVAGAVLAGNPNGVWNFYSEVIAGAGSGVVIPANSLLARWQAAESVAEKRELAEALAKMLQGVAPEAKSADGALYRQLRSLAGPLFGSLVPDSNAIVGKAWGLDEELFDGADLKMRAPAVLAFSLPADLVAEGEFMVSGAVEGREGSVQLQVLRQNPGTLVGLVPSGTTVKTVDGTWTNDNQRVSYAMPVVVNEGSLARRRFEAAFAEFRQVFPASVCYTKIVPVDEVVTMTLYHREDGQLKRLLLEDVESQKLDELWQQLYFVSRAPLLQVDAFEQLWQFATQDADPTKFEPMRQPIVDLAVAFKRQLVEAENKHVEAVIEFAGRAYRRPLAGTEAADLRGLYGLLRKQSVAHEEAVRLTLARVLVGPEFLYRTEKAVAGSEAGPVSDWELASRLSYFLWSSQPDAALRKAASGGALKTTPGLQVEVKRMLMDARVNRLATEFGTSWLHLRDFDSLDEKSERFFPTFKNLRGEMYQETLQFLSDFFAGNRSVLSLIDADHSYLNEAMARHYGLSGVSGEQWRRVEGMKALGRGGILGQATVLSKQSGASRTSPILRGNWVAEVLLGDKLPRPPKDVPQLPENEDGLALTMRELTERHTSDARCAGCHRRIDPYGFALENFDAIGRWRSQDPGNRLIHTRTRLMDGTEFEGLAGLRGYLLGPGRRAFVRNFCRKLLGFALGRSVQLSDEPLLDAIESKLEAGGYRVGLAIEMIVSSKQFREIRGRDAVSEEESNR